MRELKGCGIDKQKARQLKVERASSFFKCISGNPVFVAKSLQTTKFVPRLTSSLVA